MKNKVQNSSKLEAFMSLSIDNDKQGSLKGGSSAESVVIFDIEGGD